MSLFRWRVLALAVLLSLGHTVSSTAQSITIPPERETALADSLDLTLREAVRLAAAFHPGAEAETYRIETEAARAAAQRSGLYPRLSASLSETGRTFNTAEFGIDFPTAPDTPPLFDPNGQVEGPVYAVDARIRLEADLLNIAERRRIAAADSGVEAARAAKAAASERAAAVAAAAYIEALRAHARVTAITDDRALATDLLRIAASQLDAGVGVRLDVTRAEARLAAVSAELVGAANAEDQAMLRLQQACGLSPDAAIRLQSIENTADNVPGTAAGAAGAGVNTGVAAGLLADTTALFADAVDRRADIAAAEQRQNLIRKQIDATKAERLPALRVAASDGWIGKNPRYPLNTWNFSVSLGIPVFDGGVLRHRIREQEARLATERAMMSDLQDDIHFSLRRAVLDLEAALDQVDAAKVRMDLADEEVRQAQRRFETGASGNSDVVTAALGLSSARIGLVNAKTSVVSAEVRLAAIRGLLTQD
ncbi:MAG: TolC family protein [Bacteroidetes bacterium]|nr:TolC family protein [Bacteroidota bacterium]